MPKLALKTARLAQLCSSLRKDGYRIELFHDFKHEVHSFKELGSLFGIEFVTNITHYLEDYTQFMMTLPMPSKDHQYHLEGYIELLLDYVAQIAIGIDFDTGIWVTEFHQHLVKENMLRENREVASCSK
ncbi:MAG: hypothetical protein HOE90_22525 [Bacteriovoracaceae bacterium]|jgi:hypothetical protein|nr:hypothetical protein [Bacteriovoracaceae bacterium]